jgi:putative cell wall-binding protein
LQIDTAVKVSTRMFPVDGSAERVFLADTESPHDAMVAAVMAGAMHGAVLLTGGTDEAERQVDAEITRLLGDTRTGQVTFVGEPAALPEELLDGYRDRYTVRRISGDDHFATARLAAEEIEARSQQKTAILIGTSGVLEALPMIAVAAANDWPILFTRSDRLPATTRHFLVRGGIEQVHIAGPDTEVSQDVADEIAALSDIAVERHDGESRYEAAVAVAEEFFALPSAYAVASGADWPDAVVGAAYAGERRHAPLLLTDGETLAEPVTGYIERTKSPDSAGLVIGGGAVVKGSVAEQLRQSLE